MIAGITAAFGIPVDKGTISAIVSCMVGISGTTFGGKAIVSGLLKLIPGVGSALGATISAATATALRLFTVAYLRMHLAAAGAVASGSWAALTAVQF